MDREGGSKAPSHCFYSVLGIRQDASFSDVRSAYRKLALVISLSPSLNFNLFRALSLTTKFGRTFLNFLLICDCAFSYMYRVPDNAAE